MRSSAVILGLILAVWIAGSVWWYTCKIKGNCLTADRASARTEQLLVIDLDGEDPADFKLRNTGDGILQIEPGIKGNGVGMIRSWLDEHQGQTVDLVARDESQANGLLAMLIISGVPNRSVHVYIDPTLGTKERPMVIRSSGYLEDAEVIEPGDSIFAAETDDPEAVIAGDAGQSVETQRPEVAETVIPKTADRQETKKTTTEPRSTPVPARTDEKAETRTDRPEPKPYSMPCPAVETEGAVPAIGNIYYPSAATRVRCTSSLNRFANAAGDILAETPGANIVITGFTDGSADDVESFEVALKRAVNIKEYLVRLGIPGSRIETYSRGAGTPAGDNSTVEGRKLNRRVMISWDGL